MMAFFQLVVVDHELQRLNISSNISFAHGVCIIRKVL